jgi:uncharacterized protein involved in type VI secretion and phage assembly
MPEGSAQNQAHFYIELEGSEAPASLQAALLEVHIESSLHLPDVATLVFTDDEHKWLDDASLLPGKKLKVKSRTEQQNANPIFDGEIVELEPVFEGKGQKLTVRAFDRLHRLTRGRYARTFVDVSDSDIMQKIAGEVGLQADIDSSTPVHKHVFQSNQTNLEFLQARASTLGRYLYVLGEKLVCKKAPPERKLELNIHQELSEFRPRLTTSAQVSKVQVRGWDVTKKAPVLGEATDGSSAPKRSEQPRGGQAAKSAHNIEAKFLVNEPVVREQGAADALAKAVADRLEGRYVEAEGTASGNPELLAGTTVKIKGVGTRFEGEYFVTSAEHVYTPAGGYVTHFSVTGHESPGLLSALGADRDFRAPSTMAVAIVTDNNDPDGKLARVKVKYPWLSDEEGSFWARVVFPGGGKDRGIMYMPEVNDEVLVGFEHGDINQPYIIGGLYNGKDAPALPNGKFFKSGNIVQRVIKSRTGHIILLDDSDDAPGIQIIDQTGKNIIKIESKTGDMTIEMEGKVTVTAKGDMKLESKKSVEIIAATDVKINANSNVNIKATSSFSAEGTSSAEVKGATLSLKGSATAKLEAGGMTEVKGLPVKIN